MSTFERSEVFDQWMTDLRDMKARARILQRIASAMYGNFGDCEFIAEGVLEMRIHCGPGYRLYFTRRERHVYLLLVGGDKGSQKRDIRQAIEMARNL